MSSSVFLGGLVLIATSIIEVKTVCEILASAQNGAVSPFRYVAVVMWGST